MINVKLDGKQRRFNYSAWLMIALAIIVGVLGGLFAVLFRYMIDWSHNGFYGVGKILFGFLPGNLWIIMIPAIAGLVVGPLIYFFVKTLYASVDLFGAIIAIREWLNPVFGVLMIGLIGLKFAEVLGVGYES